MILSHQPDPQRRIDRLVGRSGGDNNSSLSRFNSPDGQHVSLSSSGAKDNSGGDFDIWAEAYVTDFTVQNSEGDFADYYLGADMKLTNDLLVGVMGQFDDISFDDTIGMRSGEGWMLGPYFTRRVSDSLFLDGRILWGQSDNQTSPFGTYTEDFETSRILFAAAATGEFDVSDNIMVRPEFGIQYLTETSDQYKDNLGSTLTEQTVDQGNLYIAPRMHYTIKTDKGWTIRPYGEARGIYSFGDNVEELLDLQTRLRLEAGADAFSSAGLRVSLSMFSDGISSGDFKASGLRMSIALSTR